MGRILVIEDERDLQQVLDYNLRQAGHEVTAALRGHDGLQIAQIIRFKNKSDRIYSTDKSNGKGAYASVSIALPRGASIMGFSDDAARYTISPDGSTITDNTPVPPGDDHSIHVIYSLPYRSEMTIEVEGSERPAMVAETMGVVYG